jgi:hypothetical protein
MGRLPLSFPICLAILNGSTMFVPARIRQKPRSSGARRNSGWEKRRPVAPTCPNRANPLFGQVRRRFLAEATMGGLYGRRASAAVSIGSIRRVCAIERHADNNVYQRVTVRGGNTGKTAGSREYQAGCPRQRTSSARGGTTV